MNKSPGLAALLLLALSACGGTTIGNGDIDPARVYRADGKATVTSSGAVIASCRAAGDLVLTGGCAIGGGPNGNDPNAWITQDEPTTVGFGGWTCAAWVGEPTTEAGREHVLSAEVSCYAGDR
jgi:hypothetical protein